MDKDIFSPVVLPEERIIESSLRPKSLEDFIGQERVKAQLDIFLRASIKRGETLDHILFYGPPGLGKTTLAYIVASELKVPIQVTSGPAIEKAGELVAILTSLDEGSVLFIDEIHRLGKSVEEILYPAMEEREIDIVIGKGTGARAIRIRLPRFTLIGATTRFGLISPPLRDRFGIVERLDYYSPEEILKIIERAAKILNIKYEKEALREISFRARGTPRIANRIIKRIRDYSDVKGNGFISRSLALEALALFEIEEHGLDREDIRILETIAYKFGGGPVGIETLSSAIGESAETIEEIYEPYLIKMGYIERTPRGRTITENGLKILKRKEK
ncbi:MAG TPA: Holliday junction branch migration DNA helicase RuvB [bacterium]|nr:Holliday junction branch migration DNA helicase RuvB [bacterium]